MSLKDDITKNKIPFGVGAAAGAALTFATIAATNTEPEGAFCSSQAVSFEWCFKDAQGQQDIKSCPVPGWTYLRSC